MTKRSKDWIVLAGSLLLGAVAWYDRDWRWFWATAAVVMVVWSVGAMVSQQK